jgi:ferrochelatase
MRYSGVDNFEHGAPSCLGVLLSNLGTPDAPTPKAVRRYLAEFLADPRVIEVPRLVWLPVLHGIILNTRPRRSAHAYEQVWTEQGSPLLAISRRQAEALERDLKAQCHAPVKVALGMRYGNPSITVGLEELRAAGARRVLVLPLYPQYSGATTASTFDAVARVLRGWRWLPELRMVTSYHDDERYITALKASIEAHWASNGRGERLLLSFHGIPKKYFLGGDPYHCFCKKTARLIAESLGLSERQWQVSFQSRVGFEEWLQPYTDVVLRELPRSGVTSLDVICPGFAADCLETLEEIAIRGRDSFLQAGGQRFSYIPALNDSNAHIAALTALVLRHAQGWLSDEDDAAARAASRERALAAGAER